MTPRMIFTLTTGRSGTMYLQSLLDCIPGVDARHEPEPDFAECAHAAIARLEAGQQFWKERKLPYINSLPRSIYVETSHIFVMGFASALLSLNTPVDIIVLRRSTSSVALSLWRRDSIPGRKGGPLFTFSPSLPCRCEYPDWRDAHAYQLCYWHCLETESRIRVLLPKFREASSKVFEVLVQDLADEEVFRRLVRALELPDPNWMKYEVRRLERLNSNPLKWCKSLPERYRLQLEQKVEQITKCKPWEKA